MKYYLNEKIYLTEMTGDIWNKEEEPKVGETTSSILDILKELNADKDDLTEMVNRIADRYRAAPFGYAIFDDDKYIGYIVFDGIEEHNPELRIEIEDKYQHQGIGFKAASYAIGEAFKRDNVEHVKYNVMSDNFASLALIKKLGGIRVASQIPDDVVQLYRLPNPHYKSK